LRVGEVHLGNGLCGHSARSAEPWHLAVVPVQLCLFLLLSSYGQAWRTGALLALRAVQRSPPTAHDGSICHSSECRMRLRARQAI
jgi:hypothetical protein